MSVASSVSNQMNEVSRLIEDVDKKYFDLIYKATQSIFSDLKDAKQSLSEAVANSENNSENIEEFMNKISESTLKECDSILNSAKKLNQSMAEAKHFRALEQEFRRNFENNPTELREKDFKDILTAKPENPPVHAAIQNLVSLIENAKSGDLASQEDDLVMDTEIDQAPKKCPITGKQIVNACKNTTCDHVYEREAIIAHMRGKRQVKCPYAGCTQFLNLN